MPLISTLYRMGLLGAADGLGRGQRGPLLKIFYMYPTMMKLVIVISYLKKIQKFLDHVTHLLSSPDSIFSPVINNFCYIDKYILIFNF